MGIRTVAFPDSCDTPLLWSDESGRRAAGILARPRGSRARCEELVEARRHSWRWIARTLTDLGRGGGLRDQSLLRDFLRPDTTSVARTFENQMAVWNPEHVMTDCRINGRKRSRRKRHVLLRTSYEASAVSA